MRLHIKEIGSYVDVERNTTEEDMEYIKTELVWWTTIKPSVGEIYTLIYGAQRLPEPVVRWWQWRGGTYDALEAIWRGIESEWREGVVKSSGCLTEDRDIDTLIGEEIRPPLGDIIISALMVGGWNTSQSINYRDTATIPLLQMKEYGAKIFEMGGEGRVHVNKEVCRVWVERYMGMTSWEDERIRVAGDATEYGKYEMQALSVCRGIIELQVGGGEDRNRQWDVGYITTQSIHGWGLSKIEIAEILRAIREKKIWCPADITNDLITMMLRGRAQTSIGVYGMYGVIGVSTVARRDLGITEIEKKNLGKIYVVGGQRNKDKIINQRNIQSQIGEYQEQGARVAQVLREVGGLELQDWVIRDELVDQMTVFQVMAGMPVTLDEEKRVMEMGTTLSKYSWTKPYLTAGVVRIIAYSTLGMDTEEHKNLWWTSIAAVGGGMVMVVPDDVWDSMVWMWELGLIVWPRVMISGMRREARQLLPQWNGGEGREGRCRGNLDTGRPRYAGFISPRSAMGMISEDEYNRMSRQPRDAQYLLDGVMSAEAEQTGSVWVYVPNEDVRKKIEKLRVAYAPERWGDRIPLETRVETLLTRKQNILSCLVGYTAGGRKEIAWARPYIVPPLETWWWIQYDGWWEDEENQKKYYEWGDRLRQSDPAGDKIVTQEVARGRWEKTNHPIAEAKRMGKGWMIVRDMEYMSMFQTAYEGKMGMGIDNKLISLREASDAELKGLGMQVRANNLRVLLRILYEDATIPGWLPGGEGGIAYLRDHMVGHILFDRQIEMALQENPLTPSSRERIGNILRQNIINRTTTKLSQIVRVIKEMVGGWLECRGYVMSQRHGTLGYDVIKEWVVRWSHDVECPIIDLENYLEEIGQGDIEERREEGGIERIMVQVVELLYEKGYILNNSDEKSTPDTVRQIIAGHRRQVVEVPEVEEEIQ